MSRTEAAPPRHICIVLLTGLGDVVHGLPLVNAIRDADPRVRITWISEPMPAGILASHPSIDNVIAYRRAAGLRGIRELNAALRAIEPIDVTLNLNVYVKSVWPTLLSRAPRRIGFDRARAFEGVWLASNERLAPSPRAHTADMFLEFARHIGVDVPHPEWRIRFADSELDERSNFFSRIANRPVVTIVPASGSARKDWIPERWAQVADSLENDFGFHVVLAGGPSEREQVIAAEIVSRSKATITMAMGDSVRRLAWLISGSDLVIAPDTGPVHIARALGIPVIGLYGHTNPWRVGPWRAYQDLWVDRYTDENGKPDASNRSPRWDRMQAIAVEDVLDRVSIAVERYGVTTRRSPG